MAGNRGQYADGPLPYHGGDPNRDLATTLQPPQQIVGDFYGGTNPVESGFTLTVVSGMQVQVAAGVCWANGLRAATATTTLTLNPTSTNPRYTIIRVTVTPNNPNGTDPSTGNNLIADTNVVDFVDGTAAASPTKPTLSSPYQVQVGSVLLPANTSALTIGMLNALDCAPNSLYDPSPLTNASTHRAASYTTAGATIHGLQASGAGAAGAGKLLVGDVSYGATYGASNLVTSGGTLYPPGTPGGANGNAALIGDATDGSTGRAKAIKGSDGSYYAAGQPGSQTGSAVIVADTNGRAPDSVKVGGVYIDHGWTGNVSVAAAGGVGTIAVSFTKPFTVAPSVRVTPIITGGFDTLSAYAESVTAAGFTAVLKHSFNAGGPYTYQVAWDAIGN